MDLIEAIYTTRAMRRLAPDPVPVDALQRCFDAAVRGPSGGNQQRFRFMTVTNPDTKAKIGPLYRECLDELNATQYADVQARIAEGSDDPEVQTSMRIDKSARWFADHVEDMPLLLFVLGKQGGETTTFPVLWNFCLAARAEGLGTAITTLLKLRKAEAEAILGVPDDGAWHMHAMVPVGYPTGKWGLARRRPAHESVFAERWGQPVDWEVPEPLWTPDD